jgi:hypothetical protein
MLSVFKQLFPRRSANHSVTCKWVLPSYSHTDYFPHLGIGRELAACRNRRIRSAVLKSVTIDSRTPPICAKFEPDQGI